MKTKDRRVSRSVLLVAPLALLPATAAVNACSGEFQIDCPENTVQVGGGDVDDVCVPIAGMGGGAGAGGSPGGSGGAPSMGGGGGMTPDGACAPKATRCEVDAQQTCTSEGKWGEPQPCDIACDGPGVACVVPVQLAAGSGHVCARLSNGTVRCWGGDSVGELGNGPGADSTRPVPVEGLVGVTAIDAYGRFSCATLSEGAATVSCWGESTFTDGPATVQEAPVTLGGVQGLKELSVSHTFLCALEENGSLECMGRNNGGQLGNGGNQDSPVFTPTSGFPSPPTTLDINGGTACAVLADGTVACWGSGQYGQNGTGAATETLLTPTVVANVQGIQKVDVDIFFSCAVRADKTVQCWGANDLGQLGRGFATGVQGPGFVKDFGDVERLSLADNHVCAVKADHSLWCWGRNDFGQLGNGCEALGCVTPTSAPPYVASPARVPLDNVVDVAAGVFFTCALTADGKVYCWGQNNVGQLGNGTIGDGGPAHQLVRWK